MANTYTQLYIQYVFAVKYRAALIQEPFREDIEKYITGIVQSQGHKLIAIYCMPDHCHILVGLKPEQSISKLANVIKSNSSKWINQQTFMKSTFRWQVGFGAFSYGHSQLSMIANYVNQQPERHARKKFRKEYLQFLKKFEVDYNDKYLFEWLDE